MHIVKLLNDENIEKTVEYRVVKRYQETDTTTQRKGGSSKETAIAQ